MARMRTLLMAVLLVMVLGVTHPAGAATRVQEAGPAVGQSAEAGPDALTSVSAAAGLVICGVANGGSFGTTSASFQGVRQCTIAAPESGHVFVIADAVVAPISADAEAAIRIGIDNTTGIAATERRSQLYMLSGGGWNKTVSVTTLQPLSAGDHTIHLLASRTGGSGTVMLSNPSLTAIFIPDSSPVTTCSATTPSWSNPSGDLLQVVSCDAASAPAQAFLAAGATATYDNAEVEAQARVFFDGPLPPLTDSTTRWQNVYSDGGGSDDAILATYLADAGSGSHSVALRVGRWDGTGVVKLVNPVVTGLFFPLASAQVQTCTEATPDPWDTSSASFSVARECTLNLAGDSLVFVTANGTLGLDLGTGYQALFRLGIDDPSGDATTERRVNVYEDAVDGTDLGFAASVVRAVGPGQHTFYLSGARAAGTGSVTAFKAGFTVIAIPYNPPPIRATYLPLVLR